MIRKALCKHVLALLACTAFIPVAMPQMSALLDENNTIIKFGAGLETGKEMNGFTCQVGLDWASRYSLDLHYTNTNINTNDQYTYDGTINGVSGLFTWWAVNTPLNQSMDFQLGLKGGTGRYGYRNFQYWEDDDRTQFIRYDNFTAGQLGFDLSLNYWLSDQLMLRPDLEALGHLGWETKVRNSQTVNEGYSNLTLKIGASLLKKLTPTDVIYIEPSLLLNSYKAPAVINLTVGYMIGF